MVCGTIPPSFTQLLGYITALVELMSLENALHTHHIHVHDMVILHLAAAAIVHELFLQLTCLRESL